MWNVAANRCAPDGRTWTIRVKPGIYFADDPAFKGKKRELTAAFERLLDLDFRAGEETLEIALLAVRKVGGELVSLAEQAHRLQLDAQDERPRWRRELLR